MALLAASLTVQSQVESAKVVGIVRDNSGAVLPAAQVTITNVGTSVAHSVSTDATGEYVVTELRPGTYTLTVEHEGFKKAEQAAFKLDVNQVVRIDISLTIGRVNEQITVSAAEPLVESQTSSLGQVVSENQVHDLPLNGRDFVELSYLTPGVNSGPAGIVQQGSIPENERGTGAIQANGLTATNNNFLAEWFRQQRTADRVRSDSTRDRRNPGIQGPDQQLWRGHRQGWSGCQCGVEIGYKSISRQRLRISSQLSLRCQELF